MASSFLVGPFMLNGSMFSTTLQTALYLFRAVIALPFLMVGPLAAESVDRLVLPSGLTVIIAEQHTTQAVTIRVAVRASPINEGERLGGGDED